MIEAQSLTKRYGDKTAVAGLDFVVRSGMVTGFLGPNGAGKSTTMRMIVGLDHPSSGSVTVNGWRYIDSRAPLHEVGVLLDSTVAHPGRSARNHLLAIAATHRIGSKRVDAVIEMMGLETVARDRVGRFSRGMRQRLGLATALLGDPEVLILDEPLNGLDPEGVAWVRQLARDYAAGGRTVFVSSHMMSEVAQTADHVIILGRGRIIANAPIRDLLGDAAGSPTVHVRTPHFTRLANLLTVEGGSSTSSTSEPDLLSVTGIRASRIAELAAATGIIIYELTPTRRSLEDAYMALTRDEVEYRITQTSEEVPR